MPDPAIVTERVLDTIDRTMPGGHAIVRLNDLRVSADAVAGVVQHRQGGGVRSAVPHR